jgi:hypothetical protein
VVAHSFSEESVTEGSGGERDANVAIDAIVDVILHVKVSNRSPWEIDELRVRLNGLFSPVGGRLNNEGSEKIRKAREGTSLEKEKSREN